MNRMVENYLRCFVSYHQNDLDELLASAEFAYSSSVSENLGCSPFELDLGWNPKSVLDFISGSEIDVQSVDDLRKQLKFSLEDAQFSHKLVKSKQAAESSTKYKPPSYGVGSKVWGNKILFSDAYSKSQESEKLSSKRIGPFTMKKLIGKNSVLLELPAHFKIHPVVHVVHTTPFVEQPSELLNLYQQDPNLLL